MSVDCATKKLWLAEAELALHKLLTGEREQTVTFGSGKSVTYTQANINQLKSYIADLQAQVDECDGKAPAKRGPIRFVFGR
ncbi:MAG TPA: gpW family head-tail joining protein [Pseudoxanthomonas sp.]